MTSRERAISGQFPRKSTRGPKRWASRSGEVVTYRKGEEKQTPPPPDAKQVKRQDKWLLGS